MTLSQIMTLALRQLDEDAQDISEYDGAFKAYANIGYEIAVREYVRPREWMNAKTDERGEADIQGAEIVRLIEARDEDGRPLPVYLTADGTRLATGKRNAKISVLYQTRYPQMTEETEEPRLPQYAHHALADYICYRHLSSGSMAKQSRAKFFLSSFYAAMRMIRPEGMGSVKDYRNLYEATDIRARRDGRWR